MFVTGYGVFATKDFEKGDFLLEYAGSVYWYIKILQCVFQG